MLSVQNSKNRILIVGSSGFLGSSFFSNLAPQQSTFGIFNKLSTLSSVDSFRLDASNIRDLESVVDFLNPSIIINCAGLVDIEVCESRPEANWISNFKIPLNLARISKKKEIKLIQISTDHYLSDLNQPRQESETFTAVNQYGLAKLATDETLSEILPNSLIIRTNFFGYSKNYSKSLMNLAISVFEKRQIVNGFEDVYFSPVGIKTLIRFIFDYELINYSGIFNISGNECLSKFQFLKKILEHLGGDTSLINPISIRSSNLTVSRPEYLALSNKKLVNTTGCEVPSIDFMIDEELEKYYKVKYDEVKKGS